MFLNTAFACLNGEKATVFATPTFFSICCTKSGDQTVVKMDVEIRGTISNDAFITKQVYKIYYQYMERRCPHNFAYLVLVWIVSLCVLALCVSLHMHVR